MTRSYPFLRAALAIWLLLAGCARGVSPYGAPTPADDGGSGRDAANDGDDDAPKDDASNTEDVPRDDVPTADKPKADVAPPDDAAPDAPPEDRGPACDAGQMVCGGRCADTATDDANCGACDNACGPGLHCVMGACQVSCASDQMRCGAAPGVCANLQTDDAHCGGCDNACGPGFSCVAGACSIACTAPRTRCIVGGEMRCADTQSDNQHCGGCNMPCAAPRTCNAGACGCPTGTTACGASCVNTQSDANNCGRCGAVCAGGAPCAAGRCGCPSGAVLCGGVCLNVATDNANCGACGRVCSGTTSCRGGVCTCPITTCASGFSGSGSNGGSGATCLRTYTFPVVAGRTYTISTCASYTGDTYLVVRGACSCINDDSCVLGSQCTCTATSTGTATICASSYATNSASWNYTVTSTDGGCCG